MRDTTALDTTTNTTTNTTTSDMPGAGSVGTAGADRYLEPDTITRRVMNPIVTRLVKMGVSVRGARQLQVRGRTSGEWRSVPVNLLELDGTQYLVAPRGNTQWVRNLRAAGSGRLRRGRRVTEFSSVEIDDAHKAPVLRAYLRAWALEVGKFFDGVDADSTDAELDAIAPGFPVFRVETG